jgi:hypothetical protein
VLTIDFNKIVDNSRLCIAGEEVWYGGHLIRKVAEAAFPVKIAASDGAPVRAFALQ